MKTTIKSNFRIVIEPRRLGDYGFVRVSDDFTGRDSKQIEKAYQERCEEIIEQIERHVDNIGWAGVECDTREVCTFCNRDWEVSPDDSDPDWPKGTPYCCFKAGEEFKNSKV